MPNHDPHTEAVIRAVLEAAANKCTQLGNEYVSFECEENYYDCAQEIRSIDPSTIEVSSPWVLDSIADYSCPEPIVTWSWDTRRYYVHIQKDDNKWFKIELPPLPEGNE